MFQLARTRKDIFRLAVLHKQPGRHSLHLQPIPKDQFPSSLSICKQKNLVKSCASRTGSYLENVSTGSSAPFGDINCISGPNRLGAARRKLNASDVGYSLELEEGCKAHYPSLSIIQSRVACLRLSSAFTHKIPRHRYCTDNSKVDAPTCSSH